MRTILVLLALFALAMPVFADTDSDARAALALAPLPPIAPAVRVDGCGCTAPLCECKPGTCRCDANKGTSCVPACDCLPVSVALAFTWKTFPGHDHYVWLVDESGKEIGCYCTHYKTYWPRFKDGYGPECAPPIPVPVMRAAAHTPGQVPGIGIGVQYGSFGGGCANGQCGTGRRR